MEDFKTSNFKNPVVSEDYYEVLPEETKWKKIGCSRSTGDQVDLYIFTPDGTKLRSSPELLHYVSRNSQYWEKFDPTLINFDRKQAQSLGSGTKRIINFLEEVRKGVTKEEALKSIKHVIKQPRPRPQAANNFRRKDYSLISAAKRKIGPKCVMKRWAQEGKINRKVLEVLEHHFCSSKIKPQQGQMMEWANELKIEFEDVKYWFQIMWEGKLEYEWLKSVQMEEFGTSKIDRGRPIKFFEPTVEMVVMDYYSNLDSGDDVEIVNDNGEEDCKIIKITSPSKVCSTSETDKIPSIIKITSPNTVCSTSGTEKMPSIIKITK